MFDCMFNCIAIIIVFIAHHSTNLMIYIIIAKRLQTHSTVLNTMLSSILATTATGIVPPYYLDEA